MLWCKNNVFMTVCHSSSLLVSPKYTVTKWEAYLLLTDKSNNKPVSEVDVCSNVNWASFGSTLSPPPPAAAACDCTVLLLFLFFLGFFFLPATTSLHMVCHTFASWFHFTNIFLSKYRRQRPFLVFWCRQSSRLCWNTATAKQQKFSWKNCSVPQSDWNHFTALQVSLRHWKCSGWTHTSFRDDSSDGGGGSVISDIIADVLVMRPTCRRHCLSPLFLLLLLLLL